jgi:zinc transporter 13
VNGQHFIVNQPAGQFGAQHDAGILGSDPENALKARLGDEFLRSAEVKEEKLEGYSGVLKRIETARFTCLNSFKALKSGVNKGFDLVEHFLTHGLFFGSAINATWFCSIFGALSIVFCGVLPAFVIPFEIGSELHHEGKAKNILNCLLSFAIGSLLGDVFLHLLPETWSHINFSPTCSGLWLILGLLSCFLVEKCCAKTEDSQHQVTAIMNLIANLVDNFTHGLAVGGSFLVSIKFGCLTTFAILVHEIPHEISDFAILLRADFNRWSAVKAQLLTALGGILGATVALIANSGALEDGSIWILPFTAGGFLNIALVQILPELLKETSRVENAKHIVLVLFGMGIMGTLNCLFHI